MDTYTCICAVIFLQHPHLHNVLQMLTTDPGQNRDERSHACTTGAGDGGERESEAGGGGGERKVAYNAFCVASIGGGGGSDAVGLILLRNFLTDTLGGDVD